MFQSDLFWLYSNLSLLRTQSFNRNSEQLVFSNVSWNGGGKKNNDMKIGRGCKG